MLVFSLNSNFTVFCFNFKCSSDLSKYILQETCYNNIKYFKTLSINDHNSKIAIELFLDYKNKNNNFSYKLSKYFLNKNGILIPFSKKSPYSHLNLFLGVYNNLSFNYQFSHHKINDNFNFFSNIDVVGNQRKQFICNNVYMYSSDLSQLMVNFNDLDLNEHHYDLNNCLIDEINKNSIESQNFLDKNKNNLNNFINKNFK